MQDKLNKLKEKYNLVETELVKYKLENANLHSEIEVRGIYLRI